MTEHYEPFDTPTCAACAGEWLPSGIEIDRGAYRYRICADCVDMGRHNQYMQKTSVQVEKRRTRQFWKRYK